MQFVFCADITWLPWFLPRERMLLFSQLPELPLSLLPWAEAAAEAFPCPSLSLEHEEQGWQLWPCSVAVPWPPKCSVTDIGVSVPAEPAQGSTVPSAGWAGDGNTVPEQGLGCLGLGLERRKLIFFTKKIATFQLFDQNNTSNTLRL